MACISNSGYRTAANNQADAIVNQAMVDTAIYVALSLWQRNSSSSITSMQSGISDRQISLAESILDHAKQFWPHEKALIDDTFGEAKADPQYSGTSLAWDAVMADTLATGRTDWIAEMRDRCLTPSRCEAARWDRHAQNARADIISHADRVEEARTEVLNDRRYARQLGVLGLSKGIIAEVSSYQQIAGTSGRNVAANLVGMFDLARTSLGYAMNRTQHDGWGHRAIERFEARMPYEAAQPVQPVQVQVQTSPIAPVPMDTPTALDPCGPMPEAGAGNAAWRRWQDCKGYK